MILKRPDDHPFSVQEGEVMIDKFLIKNTTREQREKIVGVTGHKETP